MTFLIEKGIPLPGARGIAGKGVTEVLRKMDVGDSTVMPKALQNAVYRAKTNVGIQVKCRSVDSKSIRVWRIE